MNPLGPIVGLDRAIQAKAQTAYQDLLDTHGVYVGTVRAILGASFLGGGILVASIGEIRIHGHLEFALAAIMVAVMAPMAWVLVWKPHLRDEWNWQDRGDFAALAAGSAVWLRRGWSARLFLAAIMVPIGLWLNRSDPIFGVLMTAYSIASFSAWTYACAVEVYPRRPKTVESRATDLAPSRA
jgi:hypothetical protein